MSLIENPDFIICSMCAGVACSDCDNNLCCLILISCHLLCFSCSLKKNKYKYQLTVEFKIIKNVTKCIDITYVFLKIIKYSNTSKIISQ